MARLMRYFFGAIVLLALVSGCGEDERLSRQGLGTGGASGSGGSGASGGSGGGGVSASFKTLGTAEQIYVTHAKAGAEVTVLDPNGAVVQSQPADEYGSRVFRNLTPGKGYRVKVGAEQSGEIEVRAVDAPPPDASFYANQKLAAGSGYITARDGIKLAVYVTLPGPADQGPYPTVVNYSGYDPAKPGAPLGDYQSMCGALPVLRDGGREHARDRLLRRGLRLLRAAAAPGRL
jgi:hypothetical protein